MTGRITRLIDDQQLGTIAAEDGQDYVFESMALSQTKFSGCAARKLDQYAARESRPPEGRSFYVF